MKKLLAIALFAFFISPTAAQAELQCFSAPSYISYVSVQNAAQCASYDPAGAVYDTASQSWQDAKTGNAMYNPKYTCVGLPPAYRTSTPGADGSCIVGYKLGQVTKDAVGNILKIDYADGSVGDGAGNYTPPPATNPPANTGASTNSNTFCSGGSCTYVPLEPLPLLPDCYGPNCTALGKTGGGSFEGLIGNSFKLLIGAGAMIAVIMIVLGALTYMFSDIVGNKKKALERIRGAMWAIVLLVSSYLILFTINPELVTFNLELVSQNTPPQSQQMPANSYNIPAPPTQQELSACQAQTNISGASKTIKYYAAGTWRCE